MRAVIQRVKSATVSVGGETAGAAGEGLCVLLGIAPGDGKKEAAYTLDRIINMRIFEDENGKMNVSLADKGGDLLIVPNFTLYGDTKHGRRPGFDLAAKPKDAEAVFEAVKRLAKEAYPPDRLAFGVFRAEMLVEINNDGPVTLILDTD